MIEQLSYVVSSSVLRYFNIALKDSIKVFAEVDPLKPKENSYVEVRVNGPDSCEQSRGEYTVFFEVNLLISLVKPTGIYEMDRIIDTVRGAMHSISLKGGVCAELLQSIGEGHLLEVNRFGQVDNGFDMYQATINGKYSFSFKED